MRKEYLTNRSKGVMGAKDFLRNNLPYAIIKENGKWIVKNRDYVEIGECHLPDKEIAKAAYTKKEDEEGNVTAIWLYNDGNVPNSRGVPSRLDKAKWEAYCERLKILITKKPKREEQAKHFSL